MLKATEYACGAPFSRVVTTRVLSCVVVRLFDKTVAQKCRCSVDTDNTGGHLFHPIAQNEFTTFHKQWRVVAPATPTCLLNFILE